MIVSSFEEYFGKFVFSSSIFRFVGTEDLTNAIIKSTVTDTEIYNSVSPRQTRHTDKGSSRDQMIVSGGSRALPEHQGLGVPVAGQ